MTKLMIFTCPKDAEENTHIDRIQMNAAYSRWRTEQADFASIGFDKAINPTAFNEYGTPLVNKIFNLVHTIFDDIPIHMYTNADIIYRGQEILTAIRHAEECYKRFLIVGRRWDIDIDFDIDTPELLDKAYELPAEWHQPAGMDYFIYPRGTFIFTNWPAFALGRFRWDNWIVWHALDQGIPVIDASLVIKPLHQNHDYSHFSPQAQAEIDENGRLARESGLNKWCTTEDATHYFTEDWVLHERKNS